MTPVNNVDSQSGGVKLARFDIWVTFWGDSGRFYYSRFYYPNVESGEHDATEWTPTGLGSAFWGDL